MHITSFVLGMLTITLVAMLVVIVVGIVKIIKLQKLITESNSYFEQCIQNIHRTADEKEQNIYREIENGANGIWRQFEETGRDVTMVERTVMAQIDETRQSVTSYIDSRIDKVLNEISLQQQTKQLIKS